MAYLKEGFQFDRQMVTQANRRGLIDRVFPFHERLRYSKGRTVADLSDDMAEGNEVLFIVTDEEAPKDAAVVVQQIKEFNLMGQNYRVVSRLLRATDPLYEGNELSVALTDETVEKYDPDGVTGRTPNPLIFESDEKSILGKGHNYPVDKSHNAETRQILIATLSPEAIGEMRPNGVCPKVYPTGESRLFNRSRLHGRSLEIYDRITKSPPEGLGAKLEQGDGIRYINLRPRRGRERLTIVA